jgi:glycerol-3-phosphate dehydrogenase (NAD(P)+)
MPIKIGIIGGGSWGTGLAVQLAKKNDISVWEYDDAVVKSVNQSRVNVKFLPGVPVPGNVRYFSDLKSVVPENQVLIVAVPSHVLRQVLEKMKAFDLKGRHVISLIKGL